MGGGGGGRRYGREIESSFPYRAGEYTLPKLTQL